MINQTDITQIIKETETGYEYLHDSEFEDIESICYWLDDAGYYYKREGFNLYASLADYRSAEKAYIGYVEWMNNHVEWMNNF